MSYNNSGYVNHGEMNGGPRNGTERPDVEMKKGHSWGGIVANGGDKRDKEAHDQALRDREPLRYCRWIIARPKLFFGKSVVVG